MRNFKFNYGIWIEELTQLFIIYITNFHFKLKFNMLSLCFNPVYNFIKSWEIILSNFNWNCEHSIPNIPVQCLKVEFFSLLIVIELFVIMPIKKIRDETIVYESISDSDVIVLKESPRLLVASEHKLQHLLVLNIHHHI
jgi:hypothetical protein